MRVSLEELEVRRVDELGLRVEEVAVSCGVSRLVAEKKGKNG